MIRRACVVVWLCGILAFTSAVSWAQTKSVAVLATDSGVATEAMRDGLRDALKAAGFVEGRNLKWVSETASTDEQQLNQRALGLVLSRPDVLVALSLPAAQALMKHTKQMPIIFVGVTDPVQAELVPSWSASGTNVTGVSDLLTLTRRVTLIRQVVAQARKVAADLEPRRSLAALNKTVLSQCGEQP